MSSATDGRPGQVADVGNFAARASLAVLCLATLLVLINFTAPIPTVSTIARELGGGLSAQTWILGSISLGLAAFLLVVGGLADDYGRKRTFVLGTVVYVLATVLCALAPSTALFVVARVIQGAGSAAILAASLGLLGHTYPPGPERARATGLWGAMIGGGIAVGPFVSAALTPIVGWRVVFGLLAALGVLIALAAVASLTESRNPSTGRLDVAGAVCLGGGIGFLVAALTEGRGGWTQVSVLLFVALAIVLLAAFVAIERRVSNPLLDLSLLTRPAFLASTFGAFFTGAAVIGFMTYIPIAAQKVLGLSVLASAGILAFWSGLSFLAAPHARRLISVVGARHQVVIGLVVGAVAQLALIGIDENSSWWRFVPGLAVAGIASGVVNAALAGLAVQSVPPNRVAMGSGANNTARYLGSSVGVALVAVIVALGPQSAGPAHAYAVGMSYAAAITAGLALLGALLVGLCRERPQGSADTPRAAASPESADRPPTSR